MDWLGDINITACIAVFILIVADLTTGTAQALYNHNFSSTKMRQGLWHKFATCFALGVCWIIHDFYPFFSMPESFGLILPTAHTAVLFMEISSIAENLAKINPELKKLTFWKMLKDNDKEDKDEKDK